MEQKISSLWSTIAGMSRRDWAFLFALIFCAALLSSKYLLSLCTIAIAVVTVFDLRRHPTRIRLNSAWMALFQRIRTRPDMFALTLVFFIYLVFSFGAESVDAFWYEVRRKLSFLVWPLFFLVLPPFSRRQYLLLFYFLLINVSISALMVTGIYLSDTYLFNRVLGYGQSLPSPMNHIRYSMLVTLSLLGGIVILKERFYWRWKWERVLVALLVAGLFIYQHLHSVRTGLVLTYLGIAILLVHDLVQARRKWTGIAMLAGIVILPLIAYKTVPTFKRKIDYTVYDIKKFRAGEGAGYADSERLRSWQAGLAITSENPLLGVGFPFVKPGVIEYYQSTFQSDDYLTPHSQFISIYAGSGLAGLILFLGGILTPLFYRRNASDPLFLVVYIVFLVSMLVEATLGNYIGSTMFLLFTCFGLSQAGSERPVPQTG